ncbi:MAG: phenylalanine--tRNA ligase subunit beta [Acidobacteriota bacterium]|nr:MAG: phenylalanine--tRNA ligase subunit beta [Acidobacteriota bacterium]
MNISYEWLQDFVDVDLSAEDLANKLTLIGLELEGLHRSGDDWIFDIETTSNRGDCLSHMGVAREVAAATGKALKTAEPKVPMAAAADGLVTIEDPDLCLRFTARIIRDVKIGPSPEWLIRRLEAVGERSISNIADITNYVMHALGQPMHAFDLDKLEGGRIVVRRAKKGERIVTLDEVERELGQSVLAICDTDKPVAVGGVMGGEYSGIGSETVNVLLEVAYFNPHSIRATSRDLGLSTEASYRFERGVDIENVVRASNYAAALIVELAGGEIGEFADAYPAAPERVLIEAPDLGSEITRLSGLETSDREADGILASLGIERMSEGVYVSPTWRHDLGIEEDLVEEVVRIKGYDTIGEAVPAGGTSGEYQPSEERKRRLRYTLASLGFDEAISYSFIDAGQRGAFEPVPSLKIGDEDPFVEIRDPIIEGASMMRPSLLPGLLAAVRTNFNHRNRDLQLFEIGKVFASDNSEDGLPLEKELLAFALTGAERLAGKETAGRKLDFFDLKGALESAFDALRIPPPELGACKIRHLQGGQAAEISFKGRAVGFIGRLDPAIEESYKFRQPVFVAEVDLESLVSESETPPAYEKLPVYPSVFRDVTMTIARGVTFDDVRSAIAGQGYELCRKVSYVDVFEGKGLPDDKRALTVRLEYRSDERTLTEEEVDAVHAEILSNLASKIDFEQR